MPKSKSTASKSTASKAKKTKAVAPAPVVQEAAPATEPTPAPTQSSTSGQITEWSDIESQFSNIAARLKEFREFQTSLTSDVRLLQKNVQRFLKETARKNKRRSKPAEGKAPRAPSGFAKPALISTALCSFLNKPKGTEMARTEVTKFLTTYIKEHNLQDPANKRRILPDKKLGKLLNVGKDVETGKPNEVTYFNLQKYMKVHFPKSAASLAAAAAASASS
jgi:upstream activation factor subunit UAF30